MPQNSCSVPDAPDIPGLTFRHFRGESDYPAIVFVLEGCKKVDKFELTTTVESVARSFEHLHNCDPLKDMVFAEMNGDVIGYTQVWWRKESDGTIYTHFAPLLPEWRGKGIRRSMVLYNECRAREIAVEHLHSDPRFFQAWADDTEIHWRSLLIKEHYKPVRYYFLMVRSLVNDILDVPVPEGITVRPVTPEHCWTVWRAVDEALQDMWGGSDLHDGILKEWMEKPTFNPGLWVGAWDTTTNEVAGAVLTTIDEEENQEYNRKRVHMGPIGVRRPYRRKGLASALIAQSLKVLKDFGMGEVVLSTDSENPTGALRLYEKMGFSTEKQFAVYAKPMD